MSPKILLTFLLATLLTSCITISVEAGTPAAPHFVTATLPATIEATPRPTRTPAPTASSTLAAGITPTSSVCIYSAVLLEDVTIPDNAKVPAGKIFTKTWRFKNNGTCAWKGFTIQYASGERMNAPDSAPVPDTEAGATVDISLDLTAPSASGSYTANFSLHNADGNAISIGTEKTFWVKIVVGTGATPVGTPASSSPSASGASKTVSNGKCQYSENAAYVDELANLINQARRDAKLPPLSLNSQLTSAAQAHSLDMACGNFLDHTGSDGLWINARMIRAGYAPSYFVEIIAVGLPQNAMSQWRNSAVHWQAVLDSNAADFGVGYAYNADSDYGGYFTVDMGRQ